MNEIIRTTSEAIVPVAKVGISIRQATLSDVPFMDSMQKKFGKQLGYFPTKQFEGYVEMGGVLVAESGSVGVSACGGENTDTPIPRHSDTTKIGYVISRDRYLKRDELGVIYQLCVAPGTQRKLVGASLIAEVFRRSAYGCKLYCCWCAQDLSANYFWESIGFVPIAFRAGSAKKSRVHIFWQRRVQAEDVVTPWWYPCATNGGAIREDRLVFPIPPGVHWKDVRAVAVPGAANPSPLPFHPPRVRGDLQRGEGVKARRAKRAGEAPMARRGVQFGPPSMEVVAPAVAGRSAKPQAKEKTPRAKNDPALVAKARELRDRWMEQLNSCGPLLGEGKYEVGRGEATERLSDGATKGNGEGQRRQIAA